MILLLVPLVLSQTARTPKIGLQLLNGSYVVDTGSKRRPAAPGERQLIDANPPMPPDPRGRYRVVPDTYTDPERGSVQGVRITDRSGKIVASLKWLFADNWGLANHSVTVVGWGTGPDDVVIRRSEGSPSVGMSGTYGSLNLRTRKQNPRVVVSAGGGFGLVIGTGRTASENIGTHGTTFGSVFRLAGGNVAAIKLRGRQLFAGHRQVDPASAVALLQSGTDTWVILDFRSGVVSEIRAYKALLIN